MHDNGCRRRSYGVCHRCGWKGDVGKVRRRDRMQMRTGRAFGRLCGDCVSDLTPDPWARRRPQVAGPVRLTVVPDRAYRVSGSVWP